jgi:hypothetical protein
MEEMGLEKGDEIRFIGEVGGRVMIVEDERSNVMVNDHVCLVD